LTYLTYVLSFSWSMGHRHASSSVVSIAFTYEYKITRQERLMLWPFLSLITVMHFRDCSTCDRCQ